MDNRQLDLAIPETRVESLASGDEIDAEKEDDESEIEEIVQYVTCSCTPWAWRARSCSYFSFI